MTGTDTPTPASVPGSTPDPVDLGIPRTVHLLGVGGAGMSGLARLLLARGHRVSGTDQASSTTLDALRGLGADIRLGHDPAHLGTPDLVVCSTAIRASNPELVRARELGVPVLRRAELLALLMSGSQGVSVTGTHGKTTTTTMIVLALRAAGLDPSFAVGGDVLGLGANAGHGDGAHFVAEADESDGSFLLLPAHLGVVTNVEADHLDHYGDLDAIHDAFRRYAAMIPSDGTLVLCADDPGAAALAAHASCQVVTYAVEGAVLPPGDRPVGETVASDGAEHAVPAAGNGRTGHRPAGANPPPDLLAVDVHMDPAGAAFTVVYRGTPLGRLALPLPGRHYVANALAATGAALAAGAPFAAIRDGLAAYPGVARRFQRRGEVAGVLLVDDYAHHPTEVAAALGTARLIGRDRVVAVFQPHLYSRTAAFADGFGAALAAADEVVVADVYAAREDPVPGVSGTLVADAARAARPGLPVHDTPDRAGLAAAVAAVARPGDLVLTMGAGDVTRLPDELAPLLAARETIR